MPEHGRHRLPRNHRPQPAGRDDVGRLARTGRAVRFPVELLAPARTTVWPLMTTGFGGGSGVSCSISSKLDSSHFFPLFIYLTPLVLAGQWGPIGDPERRRFVSQALAIDVARLEFV